MPSSSRRREDRRAVFLALLRNLAEADASAKSGDLDDTEAAIEKVGKAFDIYWSHYQEDVEEASSGAPSTEARLAILRTLSKLLTAMDHSLSKGDLETVKAALRQAKDAVNVTAALEEEHRSHASGIRRRFPNRFDK